MSTTSDFEGLAVWQRSKVIAVEVCRASSSCKDWGFRDQIMRSAVSVPSNIAEGAERNGAKEFLNPNRLGSGSRKPEKSLECCTA